MSLEVVVHKLFGRPETIQVERQRVFSQIGLAENYETVTVCNFEPRHNHPSFVRISRSGKETQVIEVQDNPIEITGLRGGKWLTVSRTNV